MPADATAIRERVRIEDVIARSGLTLEGHGRYLRCREHDSLIVDTKTQLFNWNQRGIHGDVFTWLEHAAGLDFQQALQVLDQGGYGHAPVPTVRIATPEPPPQPLPQDLHIQLWRYLDQAGRAWWHSQGIGNEAIDRFKLGMADRVEYGRCYSIPILEAGRLVNLRLRLADPPKDKYRPWTAGYGTQLFNSDILVPELGGVIIAAGEKKAIVLSQYNLPAVSPTGGCGNWKDDWTERLQHCRKIYLAFDPNELPAAWKLAERIGERAYVVSCPDKPDDYILAEGELAFRRCLKEATPYADRDYWRRQLGARPMYAKLLG